MNNKKITKQHINFQCRKSARMETIKHHRKEEDEIGGKNSKNMYEKRT